MSDSANSTARASPALPWKTKLFISALGFAVDASCRPDITVNRFLFNLLDQKSSPNSSSQPKNGVVVKSSDIVIDSSRNLWIRLYTPITTTTTTSSLPVIVYFHGGGFVFMSANSKGFDDYCQRLVRELPAVVISVNYRLAPEHRYPSQYEDGIDVLKFIDNDISKMEAFPAACADLQRCFLAGDSAGANVAHNVAVLANQHSFKNLKLTGVIAIQPFYGGEERTESEMRLVGDPLVSLKRTDWMWRAFLPDDGGSSNRDHPAVNVFGPNAVDISGLKVPATIVVVGGFDPLQDWQKRYFNGLKKRGKEAYLIEYPNAVHGFYFFPELPEGSLLIRDVKDFIQSQVLN